MDEDIKQTLTLSNGFLAHPDGKRTIPHEISFTRTLEPSVLPQSFNFLNFWFRETIYSVAGTDPFATQNANFLNLYSENRFIRFMEPIRLLHRTQIS